MVLSIVTALARNLVMVPTAVLRRRVAKDAEVLAPGEENGQGRVGRGRIGRCTDWIWTTHRAVRPV